MFAHFTHSLSFVFFHINLMPNQDHVIVVLVDFQDVGDALTSARQFSNNQIIINFLVCCQKLPIFHPFLKEFRRGRSNHLTDSDADSISQPFPPVPNVDSDLGSPYENVRPSSKNSRSLTADTSPSTSPHRWDFQRYHRPPEGFEDRRVSGMSANSM